MVSGSQAALLDVSQSSELYGKYVRGDPYRESTEAILENKTSFAHKRPKAGQRHPPASANASEGRNAPASIHCPRDGHVEAP